MLTIWINIDIVSTRKKHILLYFMWNFEASNFEIRADIFHIGRPQDKKIISIGFHMTCHFFRFQGNANISSFVFHTLCLIYPALSDENWFPHYLSVFFRFQRIANIPSYIFHIFCLVYPALSDKYFQGIVNISSYVFHTFRLIYPTNYVRGLVFF